MSVFHGRYNKCSGVLHLHNDIFLGMLLHFLLPVNMVVVSSFSYVSFNNFLNISFWYVQALLLSEALQYGNDKK